MKNPQHLSRKTVTSGAFFFACLLTSFTEISSASDVADLKGSARGITLEVFSQLSPIEINTIHSWEIVLSDDDGPVSGASLEIVGGMPEHNHGMPTQPRITQELVPGRYLLEGVRFHMPGIWRLTSSISTEKNQGRPATVVVIEFVL